MIPVLLLLSALAQEEPVREQPGEVDLNSQLYRQPLDAELTMWTNDAGLRPNLYYTARASVGYMRDPLVYAWTDGESAALLRDAVHLNVAGTFHFWRLRVGLDLPIYLHTSSEVGLGGAALGELLLDVKGTILDHDKRGFGLALAGRVGLPTGTGPMPLSSQRTAYEVELIVDAKVGPVIVAANIGHRGVKSTLLGDVAWGDQLMLRAGMGYGFKDKGGISADVASSSVYNDLFGARTTPVEAMLGGWARLDKNLVLRLGAGAGLTGAVGSPLVRGVASIAWEPAWRVEAPEPDPVAPEPEPEPPGPGSLVVRVTDQDGEPIAAAADITHISVPERVAFPDRPTTMLIAGGRGEAAVVPGRVAVRVYAEGYHAVDLEGVVVSDEVLAFTVPLVKQQRAILRSDRIEITEQVFFELDSAAIMSESFSLLEEVAAILLAYPQIRKLRIEGHTDSRGQDAYNFALSNDRAESVLQFLVAQGVASQRLNAVGYGERRPIDPRENEEAWALNRRVDFVIEWWDDVQGIQPDE